MHFRELLNSAQNCSHSTLAVGLAPVVARMPGEMAKFDDPFLPFGKAIIDATSDLVCAYVFHLGAYLALGAAGAVALERTLAYVPDTVIRILHGPFASVEYVQSSFEDAFGAHAVTLSTHVSSATIAAYTQVPEHGVFIKAPTDSDFERVQAAATKHPDQIGIYRYSSPDGVLELGSEPRIELQWHGESIIYAAGTPDWRDIVRSEALKRQSAPRQHYQRG